MNYVFKNNVREGSSLLIVVFGIFTILAFASFVTDLGMVLNTQHELQKAVESTALVGASNLEPRKETTGIIKIDTTKTQDIINETFNKIKDNNGIINNASAPIISINPYSKAVRIVSEIDVDTYFIKIFGIKAIKLQAKAVAISAPFYLSSSFPRGLNPGSIIDETSEDTDIRNPVGDNKNYSKLDDIYGYPNNEALSLGPGGYVTIRLPVPLADSDGADLYIRELGNLEGYFVFAGTDVDPDNPYVNEAIPGAGIKWENISCTGVPEGSDSSGKVGAYYVDVNYNGSISNEAKFYGSGYFDLGSKCYKSGMLKYDSTVKSAKYLKIIDDNKEDGFMADYMNEPVLLIGEHSSITPGADIDSIAILHHSRLIGFNDYDIDADSDKLIDILEVILGTNPSLADTDGDSINDGVEYVGWYLSGVRLPIINQGAEKVYFTNPKLSDNTGKKVILYE